MANTKTPPRALPPAAGPAETRMQACTFRVAGRLYGIDVLDVREINTETTFTSIPHAPPEVRGYVNLRGRIHLVLDLRRILGLPVSDISTESRLVIFKQRVGDSFGVLVDSIGDIVVLDESNLEDWRSSAPDEESVALQRSGLVRGVGKLDDELLLILKASELLSALEGLSGN